MLAKEGPDGVCLGEIYGRAIYLMKAYTRFGIIQYRTLQQPYDDLSMLRSPSPSPLSASVDAPPSISPSYLLAVEQTPHIAFPLLRKLSVHIHAFSPTEIVLSLSLPSSIHSAFLLHNFHNTSVLPFRRHDAVGGFL